MTEWVAEYNPHTGAVTYNGETYTLNEYRKLIQSEYLDHLQELNDARDISSDVTNLPGEKPYFEDDWLGKMKPRKPRRGYTFQLTDE